MSGENRRFILKHFLVGKLLNLPTFAFFWMINFLALGGFLAEDYNAYLWKDWQDLLTGLIVCNVLLTLQQVFGWNYWNKQLIQAGIKHSTGLVVKVAFIELALISVILSACALDFSPHAKDKAAQYKQEQILREVRLAAYENHLKDLPTDVSVQSLGAYILSLEAGEDFVSYLHLSDDLSNVSSLQEELNLIQATSHQNQVLTYLNDLNLNLSNHHRQSLALALHRDNGLEFMSLLEEPFEDFKSFVKNPLYAHIMGFELVYFQENLILFWREEVDLDYMRQLLDGILFRLEQAQTLTSLGRGDLEFLTYHEQFFKECLELLEEEEPRVVQNYLNSYEDELHIISTDKDPYSYLAEFLATANFSY